MKIIDSRIRLRTEQLLKIWTDEQRTPYSDYVYLYKMKSRISTMPVKDLIELAAANNIEQMLAYGITAQDNEEIIRLAQEFQEIIPIAGISIEKGIRYALRDIKKYFDDGFAAIFLSPFTLKHSLNDRLLYPLYGLCELLQKPIIVHGAIHFWRGAYMWNGQPQHIDEIAVDFPELKIIVSHGGNGFGPPILSVAQRHPNVYLEYSALNPSYMAPEFLYAANTYLKNKCIFGTDYPLVDFNIAIDHWKKVLRENVQELFFRQNVLDALYKEPVPY
ncbi:MAG: amidohydrolase family protein [Deltaproteobacteria bacterium]|nr:amidohydrolase family protein [Deltaproteobacteria bacterium]